MELKPYLSRILIYPFKGLDPVEVNYSKVVEKGSLEHDREFVLMDEEDKVVSGKREKKLHRIRLRVDFEGEVFSFAYEGNKYTFRFEELKGMSSFFSEVLGYQVHVRRFREGGIPDDKRAHGPTVVSTATLREVSEWFGLDEDNVRRRFRANLEIDGVPPFWEDRLVVEDGGVRFKIGNVVFEGVGISKRCPVPTRDPSTGEELRGFVKLFISKRRKSLPPWSPREKFSDTYYRLCINTSVPDSEAGKVLRIGDLLKVL